MERDMIKFLLLPIFIVLRFIHFLFEKLKMISCSKFGKNKQIVQIRDNFRIPVSVIAFCPMRPDIFPSPGGNSDFSYSKKNLF